MFEPVDPTVRNYTNYYVRDFEKDNRTLQVFLYVFATAFSYLLVLICAGYCLFYTGGLKKWKGRKIQKSMPSFRDNLRDLSSSILSNALFAACMAVPLGQKWFQQHGYCDLDVHHSWSYAIPSSFLVLVLHETYFFWTHRLFHTKWFFDNIHYVHHLARNPSPFSILLLHPIEAILQGIFYAFTFFFLPTTRQQLALFYMVMHAQDLYVHLGYEIYPKNWNRHWLGRHLVTSVGHNLHHSGRKGKGNYSFYTTFWDQLCGTEIKGYDDVYDQLFVEEPSSNGKVQTEAEAKEE